MGRTDELDVAAPADFGKMGVLGQESVPRVNRLHVADLRGADHPIDLQVTVPGPGGPNTVHLIRELEISRTTVGLAEDHHGLDPQFPARPDDPQGDLTTIGYQDSFEHRWAKTIQRNRIIVFPAQGLWSSQAWTTNS